MAKLEQQLVEMLSPSIEALGFELMGIELIRAGSHTTLRLYIDHEEGITVDDCAEVSHQASAILDVEDPITHEYNLEVSSPGADRPLFKLEHFMKVVGENVSIRLVVPQDGRRNYKGLLTAVDNGMLVVVVDNKEYRLMTDNVDRANLVPDYNKYL